MSIFALDDVIVRVEFHVMHGLWLPAVPFFYNTTRFLRITPSRALTQDGGTRWRMETSGEGMMNDGSIFYSRARKLSPYVSFEEQLTPEFFFFGMVYELATADEVMPPLNLPGRFADYERGRVLASYNTTHEADGDGSEEYHVPTILEEYYSVYKDNSWWQGQAQFASGIAYKQQVDLSPGGGHLAVTS